MRGSGQDFYRKSEPNMDELRKSQPDILKAARDSYVLERKLGKDHESALDVAIESALRSHSRAILNFVKEYAISEAEILDTEEDEDDTLFDDGVGALLYLARELDEMIPMDDRRTAHESHE